MHQVYLSIENTRTWIYGATTQILEWIDQVTSFPLPALGGPELKRYHHEDAEHAWDGWVRFLDCGGQVPSVPTGLRDIVLRRLQELKVPCAVQDCRQAPETDVPRVLKPIPLWDHQELAVRALMAQPDVVVRMPPRSGKTRTLLETVRRVSLPTLWIAPTTSIVDQTVRAAREWFSESDVVQVGSANWDANTNTLLAVCTSGGMLQLPSEFFATRRMLVCDEVHHFLENGAWGRKLAANTQHIYHRKGMTGTFFRSNGDDLAMLAFIGRVGYSIGSQELLDKGYLVPTYQCFVPIDGPKLVTKTTAREYFAPTGPGTLGIAQHPHRNDVVASVAKYLTDLGRTVLVLVATKVQGYEIKKRLDPMFTKVKDSEFDSVEFASTDRPKAIVQKLYRSFSNHEEVKILIGTSMVGEGVDLPPADALIYAAGRKAAVQYVQALYHVCTAYPGKAFGVVVDFVDRHHKGLLEHSRHRWRVASSDPVFRLSYLTSLEDFPAWSANTVVIQGEGGA